MICLRVVKINRLKFSPATHTPAYTSARPQARAARGNYFDSSRMTGRRRTGMQAARASRKTSYPNCDDMRTTTYLFVNRRRARATFAPSFNSQNCGINPVRP
jgi:hypothetical protein